MIGLVRDDLVALYPNAMADRGGRGMSDIPRLRHELEGFMAAAKGGPLTVPWAVATSWRQLTIREPAIHTPRAGSVKITTKIIRQVFFLADRRRLNLQQIASERHTNMARASETLTVRELYRDGFDADEIAKRRPRISRKLIALVLGVLEDMK